MAYLLQTDLQAMMQEEGITTQTNARPASPAVGGDRHGVNQSQERNNSNNRTNYSNQSASEGRNPAGSNSRQSRLPPKRKDPESKSSMNHGRFCQINRSMKFGLLAYQRLEII